MYIYMYIGQRFSTSDQDNSVNRRRCAQTWGAFWYYTCSTFDEIQTNPNGIYKITGIRWLPWQNSTKPLKRIEMKIRPTIAGCSPATINPAGSL